MLVTLIERSRRRRGRASLFLDGVWHCDLLRSSVSAHGLRVGREVDASELAAIVAADARRAALDVAASMLARRPRSEREVRRRMAERGIEAAQVDDAIGRLKALRLIDDAEFARAWTESRLRSSPRGARLLAQELRQHGVEAGLVRAAVANLPEEESAYEAASRRLRSLSTLDDRLVRAKLSGYLQRRGFGWGVTAATVERCLRERADAAAE